MIDHRIFLLEKWRQKDKGKAPVLFPPDLSQENLPSGVGRRYRQLWFTYEGGTRVFEKLLKQGWQKTPRVLRMILSLGYMELVWENEDKRYATVSALVDIAKKECGPKAASLINGCLRNVCRKIDADEINLLASFPERLREEWRNHPDKDTGLLNFLKTPHVVFWYELGSNSQKSNHEEGEFRDWSGGQVWVPNAGSANIKEDQHKEGFFQNIHAAEVCFEVQQKLEGELLDLCAAPGGKTWQISRLSKHEQEISMFEINLTRRKKIERNPLLQIFPKVQLLTDKELINKEFSSVLLDVPCSNSGVLNKSPEAMRHFWQSGDDFAKVQIEILEQGLSLLRQSGNLFYATCSICAWENEQRIRQFCQDFSLSICFERRWWPDDLGGHGAYLAQIKL